MNNFQRWPPLNCLRGFEAAARHSSFSGAARELNMTQSAISHQIKTLEAYLEQPLFIRVNRKVVLSDAGRALLDTTRDCLELFARGLQKLEHFKKPNQLIVHTSAALGSRWLVPRLGDFRRQSEEVDVWLYTTDMEPDLDLAEVHLAVLHGKGQWPGLAARMLLPDLLLPVCAPTHPLTRHADRSPATLCDYELLHGETGESWQDWFFAAGLPEVNPIGGANYSNPSLMLQSAEQGDGIALASLVLAADAIDTGRLVTPFKQALPSRFGYYLVTREDGLKSENMALFVRWLISLSGVFRDGIYRRFKTECW